MSIHIYIIYIYLCSFNFSVSFVYINQALQSDVASHKDLIDRLEDKASQVKDSVPRSMVAELKARYQALVDNSRVSLAVFLCILI